MKNKTLKLQSASSECKKVMVAEADLLAYLSCGELSGPWASCYLLEQLL